MVNTLSGSVMSAYLLILTQHLKQMVIQMMRSSPWNIQMPL